MRTKLALLLAALALSLVLAGAVVTPPRGGDSGGISTYDDYASLPSGAAGDTAQVTDTGLVWVYNSATGYWLPPDVQPSSLIADYDCSVLPTAATPAWASAGAEDASVSGGVLTIVDDGGSYRTFNLTSASIASTGNVGMLVRARVTSQDISTDAARAFFGVRPGSIGSGRVSLAAAAALSADGSVCPVTGQSAQIYGSGLPGEAYADNNAWTTYLLTYRADADMFNLIVLGGYTAAFGWPQHALPGSYLSESTAAIGCGSEPREATVEFDFVQVFAF